MLNSTAITVIVQIYGIITDCQFIGFVTHLLRIFDKKIVNII